MQVAELSAFMRCAELGGLSAASRAQQLPKSTLSRLLRDLEGKLKVRLFERSAKGLILTDEGRAFLPHARRVLDAIDIAAASATAFKDGPMGDVRLTAPYTFGVTFIAPLLPAFLKAHPGLNVHMELTSRNVDLVGEGFDMAVRIGRPPQSLIAHRLTRNRLRLCASAEYCARFGEPQTPAELSRHPLLLIGSSRAQAALKLSNGRSRVVVTTPARLLSSDPSVILQAVKAGAGVGEVPEILAQEILRRGALVPVLPAWSLPIVDISLIYPKSRVLAPRAKALIDYLRKNVQSSFSGEQR
jgi:DNA-binding transcriptional LysR family regulator